MRNRLCLAPLVLAAVAAAGCVSHPGTAEPRDLEDLRREDGWVLLDGVPFVPQDSQQDCGAAALAMVLQATGVDVPAATLRQECAAPGVEGLRAAALRDAARRRGLSAFLFTGRVADLEHELRRGRPVLVGLVKTLGPVSATHFEVVVGLRGTDQVAALDPARGLVCDSLPAFAAEWRAARGVTLVVFRPAEERTAQAAKGP